MSNTKIISIEKRTVEHFISVDYGLSKVTLTMFLGRNPGTPAPEMELSPAQARNLAGALMDAAHAVEFPKSYTEELEP